MLVAGVKRIKDFYPSKLFLVSEQISKPLTISKETMACLNISDHWKKKKKSQNEGVRCVCHTGSRGETAILSSTAKGNRVWGAAEERGETAIRFLLKRSEICHGGIAEIKAVITSVCSPLLFMIYCIELGSSIWCFWDGIMFTCARRCQLKDARNKSR